MYLIISADGFIDFEEYYSVMKTRLFKLDFDRDRQKTAFKVLDMDQDGFITAKELEHAMSQTGDHFTDKEITNIIVKADTNKDGKIDFNGMTLYLNYLNFTEFFERHFFFFIFPQFQNKPKTTQLSHCK